MKNKILPLIAIACLIAMTSCGKMPAPDIPEPDLQEEEQLQEPQPTITDLFCLFAGTRADAPFEGTVWVHETGEQYSRYLWFSEGKVQLFYGLYNPKTEELERWSPFYDSDYELYQGTIITNLLFPLWGDNVLTQKITLIKDGENAFTITAEDEPYTYYGKDPTTIESMWMIITVNPPRPWGEDNNTIE